MRDLTSIHIYGIAEDKSVYVDDKRLNPATSIAVRNHSLDGFNWGYNGSGCSQLALGILLEFLPYREALGYYQMFKEHFVATWEGDFDVVINLQEWFDKHNS